MIILKEGKLDALPKYVVNFKSKDFNVPNSKVFDNYGIEISNLSFMSFGREFECYCDWTPDKPTGFNAVCSYKWDSRRIGKHYVPKEVFKAMSTPADVIAEAVESFILANGITPKDLTIIFHKEPLR